MNHNKKMTMGVNLFLLSVFLLSMIDLYECESQLAGPCCAQLENREVFNRTWDQRHRYCVNCRDLEHHKKCHSLKTEQQKHTYMDMIFCECLDAHTCEITFHWTFHELFVFAHMNAKSNHSRCTDSISNSNKMQAVLDKSYMCRCSMDNNFKDCLWHVIKMVGEFPLCLQEDSQDVLCSRDEVCKREDGVPKGCVRRDDEFCHLNANSCQRHDNISDCCCLGLACNQMQPYELRVMNLTCSTFPETFLAPKNVIILVVTFFTLFFLFVCVVGYKVFFDNERAYRDCQVRAKRFEDFERQHLPFKRLADMQELRFTHDIVSVKRVSTGTFSQVWIAELANFPNHAHARVPSTDSGNGDGDGSKTRPDQPNKVALKKGYDKSSSLSALKNELVIFKYLKTSHENIVRFRGYLEEGATIFPTACLVFEWYEYGSLASCLARRVITWRLLLDWCRDLAQGMAYLHGRRIVHRDVKSDNVLVRRDRVLCFTDFGLAQMTSTAILSTYRANADDVAIEVKQAIIGNGGSKVDVDDCFMDSMRKVGSRRYMAPEILSGHISKDPHALPKADIYSLGLVFWEIMSRCVPRVVYERNDEENASHDLCLVERHCTVDAYEQPYVNLLPSGHDWRSFALQVSTALIGVDQQLESDLLNTLWDVCDNSNTKESTLSLNFRLVKVPPRVQRRPASINCYQRLSSTNMASNGEPSSPLSARGSFLMEEVAESSEAVFTRAVCEHHLRPRLPDSFREKCARCWPDARCFEMACIIGDMWDTEPDYRSQAELVLNRIKKLKTVMT